MVALIGSKPILGALGLLYGTLGIVRARRGVGRGKNPARTSVLLGLAALTTQMIWLSAISRNFSTKHTMDLPERHYLVVDNGTS